MEEIRMDRISTSNNREIPAAEDPAKVNLMCNSKLKAGVCGAFGAVCTSLFIVLLVHVFKHQIDSPIDWKLITLSEQRFEYSLISNDSTKDDASKICQQINGR